MLVPEEWKEVKENTIPRGEPILLGELNNGIFEYWESEITRPYSREKILNIDYLYYTKNGQLFALRSDMFWKRFED